MRSDEVKAGLLIAFGVVLVLLGVAGKLVDWATTHLHLHLHLHLQIVAKLAVRTPSWVLHRIWAVGRTFFWINRCRRAVRDYERLPQHHAAVIHWAVITIMARRLATTESPETLIYQGLGGGIRE